MPLRFIGTLDYSDSLEDSLIPFVSFFFIKSPPLLSPKITTTKKKSTRLWKSAFGSSKFSGQLSELFDTLCKMTAPSVENSTESSSSLATLAPLQAVLFDVDGTLCDSDPLHYYAFREMLLEIGYNGGVPVDEEWFIKTIAGKHNNDIASALFPDDQKRGLKFCDDKEAMFRRLVKEQLKPIDGVYKVKKWIEDRGLKRAAVTNAPRLNAELIIEILGLKDFFDVVIIGSECERAKPNPDPYFKALELLQVSKDHTFIFEDSFSGIKAGVAAGVPVVGLATRNPAHILMEAKPAFLIKDYEDSKLWAALEEMDKRSGATTTRV